MKPILFGLLLGVLLAISCILAYQTFVRPRPALAQQSSSIYEVSVMPYGSKSFVIVMWDPNTGRVWKFEGGAMEELERKDR